MYTMSMKANRNRKSCVKIPIKPFNVMVNGDTELSYCLTNGFGEEQIYNIGDYVYFLSFSESSAQNNLSHLNCVDILKIECGIITHVGISSHSGKNVYSVRNVQGFTTAAVTPRYLRPGTTRHKGLLLPKVFFE